MVFVHGCFWHRHRHCRYASTPDTNRDFWERKFAANVERDQRVQLQLRKMGWQVLVVWECATSETRLMRIRQLIVGRRP